MLQKVACAMLLWLLAIAPTVADDWVASRLRGQVVQSVQGEWIALKRGAIVPDDRVVRTLGNGYITLERGAERLALGPNTQIQIFDKAGSKPFTTVKQDFGTLAVEAEVKNVKHFAVQTPYLAAVVKGTRFTVSSGPNGASVEVRRGQVEVADTSNGDHVILAARQSASVAGASGPLIVEGAGKLPVVVDRRGNPVKAKSAQSNTGAKASAEGSPAKGKGSAANDDAPRGGAGGPDGLGAGSEPGGAASNSGGNGNSGNSNGGGNSGNSGANPGGNGNGNSNSNGNSGANGTANGNSGSNASANGNGAASGNGNSDGSGNAGGNSSGQGGR